VTVDYLPRLADAPLAQLFADLPAVSLVGPRACGKTTTASRLVSNIVHFDRTGVAQAFRDDADAALRAVGEPVVLDEWQYAPEVLGAVKRALDSGSGAGRFLMTASVSAQLEEDQWPATGRVTEFRMVPMTVAELNGSRSGTMAVDRFLLGTAEALQPATSPTDAPDIAGYLDLALRSGFPQAAITPKRSRAAWLRGYRDQIVARDSQLTKEGIDPARFGQFLEAVAMHSATVTSTQTLSDLAQISRTTSNQYERLLTRLHLLVAVPAWSSRRVQRLVKAPKRFLADAGLTAAVLDMTEEDLLFDATIKGRILETFVAAQLMAEVPFATSRPRLFHFRDANGRREIDLLLQYPRGRVVAVEVKAASTVSVSDAAHMRWLRDALGEAFVCGVVLYTGAFTRELDDRIFAAPISTLWAD